MGRRGFRRDRLQNVLFFNQLPATEMQDGPNMTHTPHELAEDFPEHVEKIHDLKQKDAHFTRLMDEYHTVNRAIHRAETNVEPVSEQAETEMRKRRVHLKDELAGILNRG